MDDFQLLQQKVNNLEKIIMTMVKSDQFILNKDLVFEDGRNIIAGTGTGLKIGTEATQKLGFFNTTPVVQPSAITEVGAVGGSYVQAEVQEIADQTNELIRDFKELGLGAS